MKKIFTLFVVLCFSSVSLFAKTNTEKQLSRYMDTHLTQSDLESINEGGEVDGEAQSGELDSCPFPDTAQDIKEYITDEGDLSASGLMSDLEKRVAELYAYVEKSKWRTGKYISEGDREFVETIKTICFGLIKLVASSCGGDAIFDRTEQALNHLRENNEEVKRAEAEMKVDIMDAIQDDNHTVDHLYVKVQHNAFNLLLLNLEDYKRLVAKYPEVEFLMEDMFTFFKWRADLRAKSDSYKLNEDNINVEFRLTTHTNSFFAWWELANIAKMKIRQEIEKDPNAFRSVTDERDSMKLYDSFARRARYFGRLWNGIQRFAVKKGALDKSAKPVYGAYKASIKKTIKKDFDKKTNEELVAILDDIRAHYVKTRQQTEKEWLNANDNRKNPDTQTKEVERQLQQGLQQNSDSTNAQGANLVKDAQELVNIFVQ